MADPLPSDWLDLGMSAAFGPPHAEDERTPSSGAGSSVLGSLAVRGMHSRVMLRELPNPHDRPILGGSVDIGMPPQLGRYHVQGEIARGGVGVVYRAFDPELGRDVAVKVLNDRYLTHRALLSRFVEEAQIGGQLEHPGIVAIHDVGMEGGRPFFVMRLVQGRNLAELLRQQEDPRKHRRRLLGLFEKICETMAYAHARGVIHRDLKPANIMIGAFGEVQVMDWGMGKILRDGIDVEGGGNRSNKADTDEFIETIRSIRSQYGGHASILGSVMGTPAYMPPEQALGEVDRMDERSDVFALGAILCEIVTGQPPYVGERSQVLEQATHADLTQARERLARSDADERVLALAERCLHADMELRPASAEQVAAGMSDHLANLEQRAQEARISAAEARVKVAAARKAQRLTLGLAFLILLGVVFSVGGYLWYQHEESQRIQSANDRLDAALREGLVQHGRAQSSGSDDRKLWAQAVASAHRVEDLMAGEGIRLDLRRQSASFVERVHADEREAERMVGQRRRDREMALELESVPIPEDHSLRDPGMWRRDARRRHAAYGMAFSRYGIDMGELSDAAIVEKVRSSSIHLELCAAMDDWATTQNILGLPRATGSVRLLRIAKEADDDPWRRRLRALRLKPGLTPEDIVDFARHVEVEEIQPVSVALLADGLMSLGRFRQAVEILRRAQRKNPDDFVVTHKLALALERVRPARWQEAARMYNSALALRPENLHVLHRLGITLMACGEYTEAERNLRRVVKRKPGFARPHASLGELLRRQRRFAEAVRWNRKAVELAPKEAFGHVNLAGALNSWGKPEEARPHAEKAIDLDPGYATARCILGSVYLALGRFEESADSNRDAIRIRPRFAQAYNNLGYALESMGKRRAAVREYENAIKIDRFYMRPHNNLARTLYDLGELAAAIRVARKAVWISPKASKLRLRLGRYLLQHGQKAEAIEHLECATKLQPGLSEARRLLQQARK